MGMAETDFLGYFLFLLLLPLRSRAARALDSVQSTPPPALLQIPGLSPGLPPPAPQAPPSHSTLDTQPRNKATVAFVF